MNTPTPETDKRIGIISNGKFVVDASWARQLERERDEARKEADRQTEIANAMTEYMGEDAALILERDQLRKVCDELAKVCEDFPSAVGNCETGEHWVPVDHWEEYAQKNNAALSSYNSLPHVIAAKKGNEE